MIYSLMIDEAPADASRHEMRRLLDEELGKPFDVIVRWGESAEAEAAANDPFWDN